MKNWILFFAFFFFSCTINAQEYTHAIPQSKINELKTFLKGKKYNQEKAIFINFKIASGKNRMFIYDLKNNKILEKGLVAHGSGSVVKDSDNLKFSNVEGSYQSSLGKYEIAESYVGSFGKSYRLKGLDKTNDNAMKRAIVLHSLSCVPDSESSGKSCLSLGCPMISPKFLEITASFIDSSEKPMLMYAFYDLN